MPLSDAATRNAKPKDKPYKLADEKGMFLQVTPTGGKWWRLKYRFEGKEKLLALGTYPDVGLKDARARRDDARKLLADGVDPGVNRKAVKASRAAETANTFEVLAREWHTLHSTGGDNVKKWVPSHGERIIRRLERDIFPWIGSRPVGDIEPPELLAVVRRIVERGALETAHRALADCGQVFRHAIATGRAKRDPSGDLRGALAPVRGTHFAAITEPAKLGDLLRTLYGYQGSLPVMYALRLAPLLFVRPGELRQARWSDIDLDAGEWAYHVTKTDTRHVVPLASQAVAVLRELHALTGLGEFVFPSARTASRPMSDNALLAAMRRMGIEKETTTTHGWRATARTILDEVLGFRVDLIEHQLAHAVKDANGRAYNRTAHLPERRRMMQAWADYLDELRRGAQVVDINKAA